MTDVKLTTGETYTVILQGLGTAGYTWEYATEGDQDAVTVKEGSEVDRPPQGSLPQTFEAQLAYSITAVKQGKVELRFFLHRVWEKGKPPLKEEDYTITVSDEVAV